MVEVTREGCAAMTTCSGGGKGRNWWWMWPRRPKDGCKAAWAAKMDVVARGRARRWYNRWGARPWAGKGESRTKGFAAAVLSLGMGEHWAWVVLSQEWDAK